MQLAWNQRAYFRDVLIFGEGLFSGLYGGADKLLAKPYGLNRQFVKSANDRLSSVQIAALLKRYEHGP